MSCCNSNDVSALNVHAAGLGDRFRNVVDIVNVVRQFDPKKLADIASLIREITTAADTKSKVVATMKLVSILASMTATTVDDTIVDLLDKVLGGPALDIIISLVEKLLLAKSQAAACSDDDLTAAAATFDVAATGFDIGAIVALAKMLMQIISLLLS